MIKVTVDNTEVEVEPGSTVLQACEAAGKEIPRFCYHERLSIAGNCRMCLVEIEKSAKPVASCAMPVVNGQIIKTNTEMVKKAREGVMEFLLINHPLDCPICDQGGECDLQDQAFNYGGGRSRYGLNKRSVKQKYMGPLIKTHMNRCIHCTRCVRFSEEIAGIAEIGTINRGENMEITTFLEKTVESEMSGNVIDLCPVGALTSKPYSYEARPWELNKVETIDVMDAVGSNIRMDSKGWEVKRVLPRINDEINEEWISDKTRYACDGLLNNRIDTPYVKKNGKHHAASWKEAIQFINQNSKNKKEYGGLIGQLVDLETSYAFKELFDKIYNSQLVDFRQKDILFDTTDDFNFKFNTSINKIDDCDFILLIGANPRLEATIVNYRIRKAVNRGCKVFSIGDPGNQNYNYKIIGKNVSILDDLITEKISEFKLLSNAKNPAIIIGESALKSSISKNVISSVKILLKKINKLNGFNILHQSASNVGSLILGLQSSNLKKVYNSDLLFLLNSDEVLIDKKENQFVIYQGTHGGENALLADVILPSASHSEKNGSFVNLEGRVQRTYKASFPPGQAKEDWEIFLSIAKLNNVDLGYSNFDQLRKKMIAEYPLLGDYDKMPKSNCSDLKINDHIRKDFELDINEIDYYQTNIIARSSKTMHDCKNIKKKIKRVEF
ncbi:MAG: NADH-quinone oxidoreductase subunit G [Candidatus Pelagibacter sp.]|nr:NADH-quinone oxidoreductase subunit G [Candidatus Pelagibacter sp.]OUV87319.1 MAG: NADH-quinone oxidoreductase subunit G [Pelagibacteraceae bacterium TMED136]|tara:strand:+ start:15104 stop:17110 length:2007 start_codon:yes stop_codon:yes gene_type:complete